MQKKTNTPKNCSMLGKMIHHTSFVVDAFRYDMDKDKNQKKKT